jgi:hypothetical protein
MSGPRSFINQQLQTYMALKANLALTGRSRQKFDALNRHLVDAVVVPGQLVITGDDSTPNCTAEEAYLMSRAAEVYTQLLISGNDGSGFML